MAQKTSSGLIHLSTASLEAEAGDEAALQLDVGHAVQVVQTRQVTRDTWRVQAWLSDPDTNLGLALTFPDLGSAPPPVLAADPELLTGELWCVELATNLREGSFTALVTMSCWCDII